MIKIQPEPPIAPIEDDIITYINQVDDSLFGLKLFKLKKMEEVTGHQETDIKNTISAAIKATFDVSVVKITPEIQEKFEKIFKSKYTNPFRFVPTTHILDVFEIPPLLSRKLMLRSGIIKEIVAYGTYDSTNKIEIDGKIKADIETALNNIGGSIELINNFVKNVVSHFDNAVNYINYEVKTICDKNWSFIYNGRKTKVPGVDIRIKNISEEKTDRKKIVDISWIGSILISDYNNDKYVKISDKNNIEIKKNETLIFYKKDSDKVIVYCIAIADMIEDDFIKFNYFVMTSRALNYQSQKIISIKNDNEIFK